MLKKFAVLMLLSFILVGCLDQAEEDDDSSSPTTTPTYGFTCAAGTTNRGLFLDESGTMDDTGMYIEDATGTTITSVSFRNVATFNGNYGSFTMTLTATACEFASTVLGTTTATIAPFINNSYHGVTFTFSPAITIPTNCPSGKKTVAFVVTNNTAMNTGDLIYADAGPFSASCPMQRTDTLTPPLGNDETGKSMSATVVAQ
jgi:hypothetical protein